MSSWPGSGAPAVRCRGAAAGTVPLAELQLQHDGAGRPCCLGAGNFGAVYRARLGGDDVAVKVFASGCQDKEEVQLHLNGGPEAVSRCHATIAAWCGICGRSIGALCQRRIPVSRLDRLPELAWAVGHRQRTFEKSTSRG